MIIIFQLFRVAHFPSALYIQLRPDEGNNGFRDSFLRIGLNCLIMLYNIRVIRFLAAFVFGEQVIRLLNETAEREGKLHPEEMFKTPVVYGLKAAPNNEIQY